jgi:8-oxo-dGTP pyrophosphatase MutT (NUDIX family)
MHREPLLRRLARHREVWPEDAERVARVVELVRAHERCLSRDCLPGHVTASAWIVTPDRQRCLLTHHGKLDRWLQLGGHADGEPHVHEVALREAREESGMQQFELVRHEGEITPLDVDVHWIPPRRDEPGHWHHDVRFLLIADPRQPLVRSEESHDLRWFAAEEVAGVTAEESVLRLARRARTWGLRCC